MFYFTCNHSLSIVGLLSANAKTARQLPAGQRTAIVFHIGFGPSVVCQHADGGPYIRQRTDTIGLVLCVPSSGSTFVLSQYLVRIDSLHLFTLSVGLPDLYVGFLSVRCWHADSL